MRHTRSTSSFRSLHEHSSSHRACGTSVLNDVLSSTRLKPFVPAQLLSRYRSRFCRWLHWSWSRPSWRLGLLRVSSGSLGDCMRKAQGGAIADMIRSAAVRLSGHPPQASVASYWPSGAGHQPTLTWFARVGASSIASRGTLSGFVEVFCLATAASVECRVATSHTRTIWFSHLPNEAAKPSWDSIIIPATFRGVKSQHWFMLWLHGWDFFFFPQVLFPFIWHSFLFLTVLIRQELFVQNAFHSGLKIHGCGACCSSSSNCFHAWFCRFLFFVPGHFLGCRVHVFDVFFEVRILCASVLCCVDCHHFVIKILAHPWSLSYPSTYSRRAVLSFFRLQFFLCNVHVFCFVSSVRPVPSYFPFC